MTSPPKVLEEDGTHVGSGKAGVDSVQTTDVGDVDLTATASLDESAAAGAANWPGLGDTSPEQSSVPSAKPAPPKEQPASIAPPRSFKALTFPRLVTAAEILEDSDDEFLFCGPVSHLEESVPSEAYLIKAWTLGPFEEDTQRRRRERREEAARRGLHSLILPQGDIEGENQKYICVFQVGLEDDEEFCLVKRILGKAGNNMRRIADDCNAKVRLRGIGSGFLEGSDGTEANMPLQLNVSCTEYPDYVAAVDQVATLLRDLYKHYRRYARSKGMEPPDVRLNVEEVRRDDLRADQLQAKVVKSPAEREQDRQLRLERRERERENDRKKLGSGERITIDLENALGGPDRPIRKPPKMDRALGAPPGEESHSENEDAYGSYDDELRARKGMLPSGAPMPTTPAGRRAAARSGGAQAAALASAAAREAEREEREKQKYEKEKRRRENEEKAAAAARKPGRHAPRGMGLVIRSAGDAQQLSPDGQLPIGANTAASPPAPAPKGKGKDKSKGKEGKGKSEGKEGKGKFDGKDGKGKFDAKDGKGKFDGKEGKGKFEGKEGKGKFEGKDGKGKEGKGKLDGKDGKGKFEGKDGKGKFDGKDGKGTPEGKGKAGKDVKSGSSDDEDEESES